MIKVLVKKENDNYKNISLKGHAMFADYGKDIVCSSVSSIVTTTVNAICRLNEDGLSYLVSEEGMELTIKSNDNVTQTLIENMVSLLKELEEQYPANIEVK